MSVPCPKCGGPTEQFTIEGRPTPATRCLRNGCTWSLAHNCPYCLHPTNEHGPDGRCHHSYAYTGSSYIPYRERVEAAQRQCECPGYIPPSP